MNIEINNLKFPKKIIIIVFYIFSMTMFAFVMGVITTLILQLLYPNNPKNEDFAITILNFLIYAFMFLGFIIILNKYYYEQLKNFKKNIFMFIIIAVIGWFFSFFLNAIVNIIFYLFEFTARNTENQDQIIESMKYPLFALPMVIIFAPLVEETVFRGVIFNFAKELKLPFKLNIILAFILSSSLFGLIHVITTYLTKGDVTELILGIPYIVMGFVFTLIYYISKNIFVPILTHFFQNLFASFIILIYPLLEQALPQETTTTTTEAIIFLLKLFHLH